MVSSSVRATLFFMNTHLRVFHLRLGIPRLVPPSAKIIWMLIAAALIDGGVFAQSAVGHDKPGTKSAHPARLGSDDAVQARLDVLKAKIIPEVSFQDIPLAQALSFLETQSQEPNAQEPAAKAGGLRLLLSADINPGTRVNLRLKQAPWSEVLHYLASLVSAQVHVAEGAVILSKTPQAPALSIKLYPINPSLSRHIESLRSGNATIREALQRAGIDMPLGSSAIYNPSKAQLIVRHTEEGHRRVRAWLAAQS